jgi:hypothetical protein
MGPVLDKPEKDLGLRVLWSLGERLQLGFLMVEYLSA